MANQPRQNDSKYRISQVTWRRWTGRQWKTLAEQARLYGFPLDAKGIDLPAFASWFHNFLAANARKLNSKATKNSNRSAALEKWRRERARIAEIQRMALEGSWAPIEPIKQFHNAALKVMHNAALRLELRFGPDARAVFEDCCDDIERLVDEVFEQKKWDASGKEITTGIEDEQWDNENLNEFENELKPKRPKRPAKRKPKGKP